MRATILDQRDDGHTRCYLCKLSLEDYIQGLPKTYQDYDIQREIVSNVYLDTLVDTVIARRHIPRQDLEANWLPAATGDFNNTLRMYWPTDQNSSIINGNWKSPALI
jgi:hypothetical protein